MLEYKANFIIRDASLKQRTSSLLTRFRSSVSQLTFPTLESFLEQRTSHSGSEGNIICTDLSTVPLVLKSNRIFLPILLFDRDGSRGTGMTCITNGETDDDILEGIDKVFRLCDQYYKLKQNSSKLATLAERERRIINLAAEGVPNKAIATQLGVSIKTVEKNRRNAYTKLSVSCTAEMASLVTFNRFFDSGSGSMNIIR